MPYKEFLERLGADCENYRRIAPDSTKLGNDREYEFDSLRNKTLDNGSGLSIKKEVKQIIIGLITCLNVKATDYCRT